MDPRQLSQLIVTRIERIEPDCLETLADLVDVKPLTIRRWLNPNHAEMPNGQRLNQLWHLLSTLGIASPELDALPDYAKYVSALHAYNVVPLEKASPSETDILEILGVTKAKSAMDIIRGSRTASKPAYGTVEELQDHFGSLLDAARDDYKLRLADINVRPEQSQTTPPAQASTSPVDNHDDSQTALLAQLPAFDDIPAQVEEDDERTAGSGPPPTLDNRDAILQLAQRLGAVFPLLNDAVSDSWTDDDRAQLRDLLSQEVMFKLHRLMLKLNSTRIHRNA